MSTQSIQSQDIRIGDVFQGFYSVPDYQREFVWQAEQVEQLLTDIHTELSGASASTAPEYFIGSIVVCPGEEGVYELIDGQQRMTTLFLTLCAIRDRFDALTLAAPGALANQIATTSSDLKGKDVFRYRLDLQYEDSGDVLEQIAKKTLGAAEGKKTRSIKNISKAYASISAFLQQQFGHDEDALREFYGYFINRVKLIRIHTEDVAKALKIFETINDRGVGLDSMDLLKNLLFMKSSKADFDALKKVWKELQDTIFSAGEKPLRFLRYFIFSRYSVETLREDEIYGWLSKNEALCGYASNSVAFAKELLDAASAYRNFLQGCDPAGRLRPELESLRFLGGSAARQHLILLLAGRSLQEALFGRMVREVESLFFAYVICREQTRDFEHNFAKWAPELRAVRTEAELDAFLAERITPSKAALSVRFDDAFRRMEAGSVQAYRLRYILAKLNQHIERKAYGDTESTRWLKRFVDTEFQIEHIYPQSPSAQAVEEFGPISDALVCQRLGNLVLVEKSINASLGNRPYSAKRAVYPKSNLLLVQAISERPKIGDKTAVDRAVKGIEPFQQWSEGDIGRRQAALAVMAREIWNMSAPTAG